MRTIEYDPKGGAIVTRTRFILPCIGASRIRLVADPDGDGRPQDGVRLLKRWKEGEDENRLVGTPAELAAIANPALEWVWMPSRVPRGDGDGSIELHIEQDGDALPKTPIKLPAGYADVPDTFSPFTFAFLKPKRQR